MSTEPNGSSGGQELAIATEPVEIRPMNGGVQALFRFPNGFGASVVNGPFTYGGTSGLWELAVIKWNGSGRYDFELTYDTDVADDVTGHLTPVEVDELPTRIKNLDDDGREPGSGEVIVTFSAELRQAADRLMAEPHDGSVCSNDVCDYATQMAGLFRDVALMIDEGRWVSDDEPVALDLARRINRAAVSA